MKVAELTGARLDYWVAKAGGLHVDGMRPDCVVGVTPNRYVYSPSVNWTQGGPLIEREKIDVSAPEEFADDQRWYAGIYHSESILASRMRHEARGETPLIAAMRAYVASKFGEEVE